MENENGKLYFGVGLDNSELLKDADKCRELLAQIGTEAVHQGEVIDRAFGASGAADALVNLQTVIHTASEEISSMRFDTAQEKIGALSAIIREHENVMEATIAQMEEYKKQSAEAWANGDTETLAKVNEQMSVQAERLRELSSETATYKGMLEAVMAESGMSTAGGGSAPMLFNSEADIQALEDLKVKISETKAEISRLGAEGGDTTALTEQLSEMNGQLNLTELNAAKAAAALGSDLGGRAVEAQQSLHQLNQAVEEQEKVVLTLSSSLDEARAHFEELKASESASAAEVQQAVAAYDTLSANLTSATAQLVNLQNAQKEAERNWQSVSNEVKSHDSVMVKMLGGYENYSAIISKLPAPIQTAIAGINGMTGAAKAFIATPLGAVIAALILAFQSIRTALNSTVGGQLKLAEITGYLSGVLGQLKEIVITVGNALFKAISDPRQAAINFGKALKENVINRIKAVGDMGGAMGKILKSAFTFDLDGVKEGVRELGESFAQFGTGIDNVGEKIGAWAKGVGDAAKESASISRESRELEIEVSKWQVENQKLEQQKAKARGRMMNTSLPIAEQKKAQEEYKAAIQAQTDMEMKFAEKRIELQQRSMALTSNTIEDENTLRDLQAAKEAVVTRQIQQLAMLERRSGAVTNREMSGLRATTTATEKQIQAQQELGNMMADLVLANNQRRISLMRDGLSKTLAEIEYEKEQEQQKLLELEDKFRVQNQKAGVQTGDNGLTEAQTAQLAQARQGIEDSAKKSTAEAYKGILASVRTYEQQRNDIVEEFQRKRDELYKKDAQGNTTGELIEGATQGNIDEVNRQQEEALKAVDEQFVSRSDSYKSWCAEIAKMSLDELGNALTEAQAMLATMEGNDLFSAEEVAEAKAKVAKAEEAYLAAMEKAQTPQERSIEEWKDLYDALKDCKQAFDAVGDAIGGTVGEAIKATGSIAADTMSMVNSIVQLSQVSSKTITGVSATAATAIKAVETSTVILAIASAAIQIATKIVSLIKSAQDKKADKSIEASQKQVDRLQESYDNLGKEIDKAYSTDASKLIEQQNTLLEQQRRYIEQQKRDEQSKKKSDSDKLKEYDSKLKDINDRIEDNRQKAIDAIFGEDLQSAIDNFASAYADAWTAGEDRSKAVKDTVRNMMRQMVTESIKAAISAGGQMEAIREKLQEFYADGVLTDWEQDYVMNMASEIEKELNEKFGWADKLMKDGDSETTRTGTTGGGITTASQETVDELNGRATAIQGHTFSIAENTQRIMVTTNAILTSVLHIEDHTDDIRNDVGLLRADMKEMRNTVNDIAIKGVKIK